jgi:hypothetical protein
MTDQVKKYPFQPMAEHDGVYLSSQLYGWDK